MGRRRNFSWVVVKGLLGQAKALKRRLTVCRGRLFLVLLVLLGLGVRWGPEVPLAAAEPQQATHPEFRPGQSVVVIQPTTLKNQGQELARLRPGTEAKVLLVQEAWLWCEIATDQKSVQVLTAPSEKKDEEIPPSPAEKRLLKGWVPTAAVRPGYGGRLWWMHALGPELKDLLRRRAQEAVKDPSSSVRLAALAILNRTPGADSIPALREGLKEEHPLVRSAPACALAKLGDRGSIPALREALKDEDRDVRRAAAEALAKLGDRESIPALREALKDTAGFVRHEAAGALLMLGEYPKSVSQMVELAACSGAYEMLEVLWPEAKPRLLAGLRSEHEIDWAAWALLHLGHQETIPALIEALHRHGTVVIAEWYLNCGEPSLEAAARRWAEAHRYTIRSVPGSPAVGWGRW